MLRTRIGNAARSFGFTMRMKPASTTVSHPASVRSWMQRSSAGPSSFVFHGAQSRYWHGMLCRRARSRIFASGTSASTRRISASSSPFSIASTIDCMFEPAPEPSTPSFSFAISTSPSSGVCRDGCKRS